MVKGYSGTAHQGFSFQDQQYYANQSDNGQASQVEPPSYHSHSHTPMTRSPTPRSHDNSPRPSNYKPISFGRGTQHLLNQDTVPGPPAYPLYPVGNAWGREGDQSMSDHTSEVSDHDKIDELAARLDAMLADKDECKRLLSCTGWAAQRLLDMFQKFLDATSDSPPKFQRNLIATTQKLATKSGLYPVCYELNGVTSHDVSEFSGGFADIYKGDFRGRAVCLKTVRLHRTMDLEQFLKVMAREAILWGQLRHPNVLPFYGIYRFRNRISFVTPWMENGDIVQFLKTHQSSDRTVLSFDVAKGLQFLHKQDIIHGNLKGANILINELGRACISDFGLSSVSDREIIAMTSYSSIASKGSTVRWQAPELFDPERDDDIRNTEFSDIYAWACVAYEIFAGQVPFVHIAREAVIIIRVTSGERPAPPSESSPSWRVWGLTEGIWTLMQTCWSADPVRRPNISMIIEHLEKVVPRDAHTDITVDSLTPSQFREMTRRGVDETEFCPFFDGETPSQPIPVPKPKKGELEYLDDHWALNGAPRTRHFPPSGVLSSTHPTTPSPDAFSVSSIGQEDSNNHCCKISFPDYPAWLEHRQRVHPKSIDSSQPVLPRISDITLEDARAAPLFFSHVPSSKAEPTPLSPSLNVNPRLKAISPSDDDSSPMARSTANKVSKLFDTPIVPIRPWPITDAELEASLWTSKPFTRRPARALSAKLLISKPFRCPRPDCTKSYKQAKELARHLAFDTCSEDPHREAGFEAEKHLRPFFCGIADCPRRYKTLNGLKYHYLHSEEHGEEGMTLLNDGTHECLNQGIRYFARDDVGKDKHHSTTPGSKAISMPTPSTRSNEKPSTSKTAPEITFTRRSRRPITDVSPESVVTAIVPHAASDASGPSRDQSQTQQNSLEQSHSAAQSRPRSAIQVPENVADADSQGHFSENTTFKPFVTTCSVTTSYLLPALADIRPPAHQEPLFLPHPNAPKVTAGISSRIQFPPLQLMKAQRSLVHTLRTTLTSRDLHSGRPPTIYAVTTTELNASTHPVLMHFSATPLQPAVSALRAGSTTGGVRLRSKSFSGVQGTRMAEIMSTTQWSFDSDGTQMLTATEMEPTHPVGLAVTEDSGQQDAPSIEMASTVGSHEKSNLRPTSVDTESNDQVLRQFHRGGRSRIIYLLNIVFNQPRQYQQLLRMTGPEAQVVLDTCQILLDSHDLLSNARWQIVTAMQRLSGKTGIYPARFFLRTPISLAGEHAISSGSYGDIYKATAHNYEEALCLKVLRANQFILEKMAKSFAKEAILWSQLSHPNVLPFYGLYLFRSQLSFVSPFAENGSIIQFLSVAHDSAPDRVLLCLDTAMGVDYLHARGLVHGDIKSIAPVAYLADFGLSNIDDPQIAHWTSQSSIASKGGSARWQAPELHQIESDDENEEPPLIHNTEMSDVFAWGCLSYEIFTGLLPFYNITSDPTVVLRILEGRTPSRPKAGSSPWKYYGLNEAIWELMEKCWTYHPVGRPTMSTVVTKLSAEQHTHDPRPAPQWPEGSSARFRKWERDDYKSTEGSTTDQHTLDDLETILLKAVDHEGLTVC
ncbi:hypothetical protein H0H87_008199 [Tephrocybe sp. NHM501043]|nr:hypothetical protein H0H87_008199 [Tephrocybe sp. NHM501043]